MTFEVVLKLQDLDLLLLNYEVSFGYVRNFVATREATEAIRYRPGAAHTQFTHTCRPAWLSGNCMRGFGALNSSPPKYLLPS